VIRITYCCQCCDTYDILLSWLWYVRHIVISVINNMAYLMYHNTDNNMSCLSQHWQQYVIRITTLITIDLTYLNHDNNMPYVWYVKHIVVSFVIRKTYCCQFCDTQELLLSVLWYVRHSVVCRLSTIWLILCITTLTTICLAYHNTDSNMSYVSQHW
jgi:hypothetical protein